jgi:hypothetical protein
MTRKDYVAIAASIHRTGMAMNIGKKGTAESALRLAAIDIAATMANDNPRFDRARFLKACGVQS